MCGGAEGSTLTSPLPIGYDAGMGETLTKKCDECGSDYFAHTSKMDSLCPECAHLLYGYENCEHSFDTRRCSKCGWDGSRSDYIRKHWPTA